jgi:hypothetical protein
LVKKLPNFAKSNQNSIKALIYLKHQPLMKP